MMKNDPFEGPKLKIKRAERHIADYRQAFKAFTESSSVVVFPQSDIQTRQGQIIVQSRAPVPGEMRVTAADALYNLRAALDQAVCRCVALTGQTPKNTYFPHGADKKGFEANLREKCKKVPQPVRDAIAALEPYHGGNGSLFRVLHDLNLVDKHTDLIEILPVIRKITGTITQRKVRREGGEDVSDPSILEFHPHQDVKVTLAVTFSQVQAVQGQSVTQVLLQLHDLVRRTVEIIETVMLGSAPSTP